MKKMLFFIGPALLIAATASAQGRPSLRNQNTTISTEKPAGAEHHTSIYDAPPKPPAPPAPTAAADAGAPEVRLGAIETTTSSKEKILSYPRLIPQALDYEVKSFTFTMTAGDKTWGPETVKGAVFTEEIKDQIKEQEAQKMKISIDNIKVANNGHELTARPIVIDFDH